MKTNVLFGKWNYHTKLTIIFSIIFALVIIVFNYLSYTRESQKIRSEFLDSKVVNVEQTAKNLEMQIFILSRLTFTIVSNKDIFVPLSALHNENQAVEKSGEYLLKYIESSEVLAPSLTSYLAAWDNLTGISIFASDGANYYFSKSEYFTRDYDFKKENWYNLIETSGENSVYYINSSENDAEMNKGNSLSFIRKVVNLDTGKSLGYLKADMDLKRIAAEILDQMVENGNGSYSIIDSKGKILFSSHKELNGTFFSKRAQLENDSGGIISKIDGKEFTVAYANIPETLLTIVYQMPNSGLISDLRKAYLGQMFYAFSGVLIIIAASFLVAKQMSKNIVKLKKAMETAESGNLDIRVKIRSQDEIGMLGESFNKMLGNIKELYGKLYMSEIESKEAQISALQAQINPHFFYNTMECIDSMAMSEGNMRISEIARALSSNFRYAFRSDKLSTLVKELQHVEDYLKILKVRYPDKFRLETDLPEIFHNTEIPRITLQPIVENAILHGILKRRGEGIVKIYAEASSEENLVINIIDNGIGMNEENAAHMNSIFQQPPGNVRNEHIGLVNVNNRIKYLFGSRFGISVVSMNGEGTRVRVNLPLKI